MAMDELEISKIVGAGCAALLAFVGFGQLGSAVVGVDQLDEPAYIVEVPDAETGTEMAEVEEAMPIGQLMAMAVVDDGPKIFKKCSACHNVEDGGGNGVGPNLHGIVGRDIGGMDGYAYSNVLAGMDGPWDFAALDGFLESPKNWAPGTKMGFAGLRKPEDRASVIAWLNEQSAAPLPLPAVETAEAEAPAETEMAAVDAEETPVEPTAEISPGDVVDGETTEVDAGEGDAEVAVVNPEAPREAEVKREEIETAEAVEAEEPAKVEEEVAEAAEEPAEVETAEVAAPEAEVVVEEPAAVEEEAVETVEAPAATETTETAEAAAPEAVAEEPAKAEEPAEIVVAEAEAPEAAPAPAAAPAAAVATAAAFMIGADAEKGAKVFRKCKACHKVDPDAGNGVGPNLHGVVGRDIAALDGFKYSDALTGKDGAWTFEALNGFLTKPKEWAKGTKMAYPGLRKEADRAAVIAWLNEQGDAPLPLPE